MLELSTEQVAEGLHAKDEEFVKQIARTNQQTQSETRRLLYSNRQVEFLMLIHGLDE